MKGPEGTSSINIAKLAVSCPNEREHLIIVTDGKVSESDIKESDKFMNDKNIKFKFVSVYVIGTVIYPLELLFVEDVLIELFILLIKIKELMVFLYL